MVAEFEKEPMSSGGSDLLRLDESHVIRAGAVLARAFHHDPFFSCLIPDSSQREQHAHHVMETLVRYSVSCGEVYATSQHFEGVAVWLPAERVKMTFWRGLKSGGAAIVLNLGLRSTFRQLSAADLMCSMHQRLARIPHWYLYLLAVEPAAKGKGHASRLVNAMLKRLDAEGLACYLDNTNESNLPMYNHFGFGLLEEYTLPNTGVRLWAMLRPPQIPA